MHLTYYVRKLLNDGTVILSRPFDSHRKAEQWARIARRDFHQVADAVVIARVVPLTRTPRLTQADVDAICDRIMAEHDNEWPKSPA